VQNATDFSEKVKRFWITVTAEFVENTEKKKTKGE